MSIKLYWFRGKGKNDPAQQNFGDYLSPLIVEMVAKRRVEFAPVEKADMMAIGTILPREQRARRFWLPRRLHIWGSGTDAHGREYPGRHYYHAVRGALSRSQIVGINGKRDIALGDPGLLASCWWGSRTKPAKKFRLGLILHYADKDSEAMRHAATLPGTSIIDVFQPPAEVLRAIQECSFILSSSLHGLIVADSFSIPNKRMKLSDNVLSNEKFQDYYSAFSLDEPPYVTPSQLYETKLEVIEQLIGPYSRPGLDTIQERLIASFPSL